MCSKLHPEKAIEGKIKVQSNAVGGTITLNNEGFGSVMGVATGGYTSHQITTLIPANKIVVLTFVDTTQGNVDDSSVQLDLVTSNGAAVKPNSNVWHPTTRMRYFRTTGASQQYTVRVTSTSYLAYTVGVTVVNASTFVPCDTSFYADSFAVSTYLISNYPEVINSSSACWSIGNMVSLVRGKLRGRCRVNWEHYNQMDRDMKLGVLLWNKGSTPITVELASRSVKSGYTNPACLDIWVDCFNVVKQSDDSELRFGQICTIPAYSTSNPSASALWVALSTVSSSVPGPGFFNGQVTMVLKNSDGSLYEPSGDGNVFCDVYIMDTNAAASVKSNVANNTMYNESEENTLRGSGAGAGLYARLGTVSVTPNTPYSLLIAGADVPLVQSGELVSLTTYKKDGSDNMTLENGFNYGIAYRFDISSFTSTQKVKGTVRFNSKVNPNIIGNYPGIYVVGYIQGSSVFKTLILSPEVGTSEYTFSTDLPRGDQVYLTVVVGDMSSPPLEITFCN